MPCPPQSITSSIKKGTGKKLPQTLLHLEWNNSKEHIVCSPSEHPHELSLNCPENNLLFRVLSFSSLPLAISRIAFQKKSYNQGSNTVRNLIYLLSLVLFLVGILIKPN